MRTTIISVPTAEGSLLRMGISIESIAITIAIFLTGFGKSPKMEPGSLKTKEGLLLLYLITKQKE